MAGHQLLGGRTVTNEIQKYGNCEICH